MTYHSVLDYIRAGRACGINDHEITRRLQKGGWLVVDVKDAFELLKRMEQADADKVSRMMDTAICPPDHAEHVPAPRSPSAVLMSQGRTLSSRHMSLMIMVLLGVFLVGFSLMR